MRTKVLHSFMLFAVVASVFARSAAAQQSRTGIILVRHAE
jgi:hypothetical protein